MLLLTACREVSPAPQPTARVPARSTPSEAARYGGVLTVRLNGDPGPLNPLSPNPEQRKIGQLVYAGLMRLDANLQPLPDLAESWTPSPDELTWTFRLRPGIRWHDGVTLTSDDVLFTFRVLLDGPTVEDAFIGTAQADFNQYVADVAAIGPYTVQLKLRRRFAPLLADLAVPVLPRHVLDEKPVQDLANQSIDVGAGPFRVIETGNGAVVLEAFSQYHLGRPFLDRVAFVAALDGTATIAALTDGRLLLAGLAADGAARLAGNRALRTISYSEPAYYYVGFNLRSGRPFAEKAVREAWTYAIDKEALVSATFGGQAGATWATLPEYSWAANTSLSRAERNLDKARDLLEAAGWHPGGDGIRVKNGQRLRGMLLVRQDAPQRVAFADAMANQLREAGIALDVAPSDFGSTMAGARRPPFDFDALLMGWTLGVDPDDYHLFHSSQVPSADRPNGNNYAGFHDETYDRLSVEARGTIDWSRRATLYRETQRILAGELPYYPLWADRAHWAISRRVEGVPQAFTPTFWSSIARWYLPR